jgi:hypothetical protein
LTARRSTSDSTPRWRGFFRQSCAEQALLSGAAPSVIVSMTTGFARKKLPDTR